MIATLKRWLADRKRRGAMVQAAREYAARTTGRPVKPWPFGHCRAFTSDRCYVLVMYRDKLGCRRGLFAVHDSGKIEPATAREVRLVSPPHVCQF